MSKRQKRIDEFIRINNSMVKQQTGHKINPDPFIIDFDNVEKLAKERGSTFRIPSRTARQSVPIGMEVKVVRNNERFWVSVIDSFKVEGKRKYVAIVNNDLQSSSDIDCSSLVYVEPKHILSIQKFSKELVEAQGSLESNFRLVHGSFNDPEDPHSASYFDQVWGIFQDCVRNSFQFAMKVESFKTKYPNGETFSDEDQEALFFSFNQPSITRLWGDLAVCLAANAMDAPNFSDEVYDEMSQTFRLVDWSKDHSEIFAELKSKYPDETERFLSSYTPGKEGSLSYYDDKEDKEFLPALTNLFIFNHSSKLI
jgi:hypothetical protein